MDLMPKACAQCGGQMSLPIVGRRTGLLLSTCRECGTTVKSATPQVAPTPSEPNHSAMFLPSTMAPEPRPVRTGAMDRFQRAAMSGTLRKAIERNRQQVRAASAIDPKLKQIGGDR
jgi:hypothetical protein